MARSAAPVPAATTSSRVRNKKLSYRQKLCVQRGSHLLNAATSVVAGPEPEFEGQEAAQDSNLGVDASEISEHHLQAALSSNQLATSEGNALAETAKAAYSIPVPDAHGTLSNAEFSQLYPPGVYSDPVTYIRFSDTVEDCIHGPSYNMDEDDQDWLETRNAKAQEALTAAIRNTKTGPLASSGGKGKAKEKLREEAIEKLVAENQGSYRLLSEEQFEMIMTVFEQVTTEQVPFLHLDVTKIPSSEELLAYFEASSTISALAQPDLPPLSWEKTVSGASSSSSSSSSTQARRPSNAGAAAPRSSTSTEWSPLNPYKNLADLKSLAEIVYPYWKSRREDREGRSVTPFLNFDETNDNDPYVCFRRREVKQIRKTRKTDALHIEKMIRLRAELEHAVALTELVAQRERTKRASLRQSRECWENVKDLMDLKRQWGIVGPQQGLEDEELISGERRDPAHSAPAKKKRKTDEAATTIKLAGRKSRAGEGDGASAGAASAAAGGVSGMGSAILERVHAVQAYIERECLRKADADLGWEEGSDAAFQPIPAPAPSRAFRPIHAESSEDPLPFSPLSSRAGRPPSFRRRVGRGGRVFLDRRLPVPSPVPTSLTDWPQYGRSRSELPGTESRNIRAAQAAEPEPVPASSALPDLALANSPSTSQNPLTGPFAFSPDVHPQLLASTAHPAVQSLLNQGSDAFGGPFARSGPFAGASSSNSPDEVPGSQHSDASSTSSESSDRSRLSGTSVGVVSTQATEVGDIDMFGLDEEHDKREGEQQRAASISDDSDEEMLDPERALQRWTRMEERWRYDDESGRFAGLGLTSLGGMEDDDEAVLDDFDQKFMRYRMTLLEEADLLKLSTDLTNLQQAQAAAEAPPPKPAGYVEQPATSTSAAVANAVAATAKPAVAPSVVPAPTLPGIPNAATLPMPSAARTAAATGGGGSQSALQAQQLQAQQQQLQMAILQQQQQQQQQAAAAQAQAQAQAAAQAQAQQAAILQQQQKQQQQQQQHQKQQQMQQQSQQQAQQQQQPVQPVQAQQSGAQQPLPQPFGSQMMSISHQNTQQAQLAAFAAAQQQLQAAQQAAQQQQQQAAQQQQRRLSGVAPQPQQQQIGLPVQMQMQMPIQMQMQLQMQMAAAAAQGQTHLLGQSMPFDATSIQAQMQQAQQHLARSMPAQSMAHSSPMQSAAFTVPNAQTFGMNLSLNMNGNAGSPPMQHARVSSQPQQHVARTSASPVSAAANGQNTGRTNPSPIMQAGLVMPQQAGQVQQQAQQQQSALNLNLSLAAAQMKNGAANLQQFQALQQQAQMLQGQQGNATAAQLMAMKAALAQNANLNLRLPPNRALQIAQQAAQAALGAQQQQQQQQAQQVQGNGNASNQGSPAMSRASTAGSPRFAANGINGGMAGSSPVQNGTSATTNATNSPSPQISAASRAAIAAATNAANAKMMAAQSPVSYHASPVQANLNLHAAQQQQLKNAAAAAAAAAAGSPQLASRSSAQTQQG
ncbi:related to EPL1 - Component of histone H4/H2A acetyltransferase complex [Ustilago trichophora]|uniref:Enhancer of polycomb-like protein n=1 Tax=Ustilago trichophora TaxID=86804 RepID=A0A5C3DU97_9BASI|nr:related to EPL1 - Component of histone H4/H2A acetyltransferase complex [Ustilago trichophora]